MKVDNRQKAALQALQKCLEEIPFVRAGKTTSQGSAADFQMEVRVGERSIQILVEYKNNGQPRFARQAALELKESLSKRDEIYGVFAAPYISPASAVICQQAGIGYLDLAGNCLLAFDNVYIKREGAPNIRAQRRHLRSLYSSKSERILRVLLTSAGQTWKTESLARILRPRGSVLGRYPTSKNYWRTANGLRPAKRVFASAIRMRRWMSGRMNTASTATRSRAIILYPLPQSVNLNSQKSAGSGRYATR